MAEVIGAAEATVLASQIISIFSASSASEPSRSELLKCLETKAEMQEILYPTIAKKNAADQKDTIVRSPILRCLAGIFTKPEAEAAYVLFAPPSIGKTTAATALLRFSLQAYNRQERPRALMVSGPVDDATYFQHMTRAFEASDTPWFDSLLGALSISPGGPGRKSSLLILDDFDEEGPGEINVIFMMHFCKELYEAQHQNESIRIHVVILTQKQEVTVPD
jgi:hypothetical protein